MLPSPIEATRCARLLVRLHTCGGGTGGGERELHERRGRVDFSAVRQVEPGVGGAAD